VICVYMSVFVIMYKYVCVCARTRVFVYVHYKFIYIHINSRLDYLSFKLIYLINTYDNI
jgi:hypothetical protein